MKIRSRKEDMIKFSRGISPLVSTVLLLVITMALSLSAYYIVTDILHSQKPTTVSFSSSEVYLDAAWYQDIKDGLLLYYSFDECEGNIVHDEAGGHDGNFVNQQSYFYTGFLEDNQGPFFTEGAIGCGVYFDGLGDSIYTTDDGIDLNHFTVFWMWKSDPRDKVTWATAAWCNALGDKNTGEDYTEFVSPWPGDDRCVRRAIPEIHAPGVLAEINLPRMNGFVAMTIYSKCSDPTKVCWKGQIIDKNTGNVVYEYNNLHCALSSTGYRWCESPILFLEENKDYVYRVYWPGETETHIGIIYTMMRRGAVGGIKAGWLFRLIKSQNFYYPSLYLVFQPRIYPWTNIHADPILEFKCTSGFCGAAGIFNRPMKYVYGFGEGFYKAERNLYQDINLDVYDFYKNSNAINVGSWWRTMWGVVDEVRIYSRALTEEEIKKLWYRIGLIIRNAGDKNVTLNGGEIIFENCVMPLEENITFLGPSIVPAHSSVTIYVAPWKYCSLKKGRNIVCISAGGHKTCKVINVA